MRLLIFASVFASTLSPKVAASPVVTADLSFGDPSIHHLQAFSARSIDAAAASVLASAWQDCQGPPQDAQLETSETHDGFSAQVAYRCDLRP